MNGAQRRLVRHDLVDASIEIIAAGQSPSGAFVASPTFSQYGYSWLRDGAFIAEALDLAGRPDRAARFHRWVARVVAADPAGLERARAAARRGRLPAAGDYLRCRYALDGRPIDDDWPNFQLDGPGIWLWSLGHHLAHGGRLDDELHASVVLAGEYLAELWPVPCADAWEESDEHVHTTTLAAILAGLEAAMAIAPELRDAPTITEARAALDDRLRRPDGAFTKWSGSDAVDAAMLWMVAPYQLVSPTDARFAATLERIEVELISADGGVHRHAADTYYGGGAWPVLTGSYGRVLLRRGRPGDLERAHEALRWIEAQADEQGRLPEQVDDHALAPGRIDEWRGRWGESARPLLWSHATYLALSSELVAHHDGGGEAA